MTRALWRVAKSCWTGKTGIEGLSYQTLFKSDRPRLEIIASFPADGKLLPGRWGVSRIPYTNGSDVTLRLGRRLRVHVVYRMAA